MVTNTATTPIALTPEEEAILNDTTTIDSSMETNTPIALTKEEEEALNDLSLGDTLNKIYKEEVRPELVAIGKDKQEGDLGAVGTAAKLGLEATSKAATGAYRLVGADIPYMLTKANLAKDKAIDDVLVSLGITDAPKDFSSREDAVDYWLGVGESIEDTRTKNYPEALKVKGADATTDLLSIVGGGIAGGIKATAKEVAKKNVRKTAMEKLESAAKEGAGGAVGATAVATEDSSFGTMNPYDDESNPFSFRGGALAEDFLMGTGVDFALRMGGGAIAKAMGKGKEREVGFLSELEPEMAPVDTKGQLPDLTRTETPRLDKKALEQELDAQATTLADTPNTPARIEDMGQPEGTGVLLDKLPDGAYHIKDTNGEILGTFNFVETDGSIEISTVSLLPEHRGKGYAVKAYEALINLAKQKNKIIYSDSIVSEEADNVYKALSRRGYDVQENTSPSPWMREEDDTIPRYVIDPRARRDVATGSPETTSVSVYQEGSPPSPPVPPEGTTFRYFPDDDGRKVPVVVRENGVIEDPILAPIYRTNFRTVTESGTALQRKYNIYINQMSALEDASRKIKYANAVADGTAKKGMLGEFSANRYTTFDEPVEVVRQLTETGQSFFKRAMGVPEAGKPVDQVSSVRNVHSYGEDGMLNEVPDVKNLNTLYNEAVDQATKLGKSVADVQELDQANNMLDDYFNIDRTLAEQATDMMELVRQVNKKAKVPLLGDGAKTQEVWEKLGKVLWNTMSSDDALTKLDYNTPAWKDKFDSLRTDADDVLNSIQNKKLRDTLSQQFDDLFEKAQVHPEWTRSQAEAALAKHANDGWSYQFREDVSKWNNFMLDEQVKAGVVRADDAARWREVHPNYLPEYKVWDVLTETVEDNYGVPNAGGNLKKKRKISGRANMSPVDARTRYALTVDKAVTKSRANRVMVDYLLDNLDDNSWNMIFREPMDKVKAARDALRSGERRTVGQAEMLPFRDDILEAGDSTTVMYNGNRLDLGVKDKELYHLMERTAYINRDNPTALNKALLGYSKVFRYVITHNPFFAANVAVKEYFDTVTMADLPLSKRLKNVFNPTRTARSFFLKELDPAEYNRFVTNYGFLNDIGMAEGFIPGETIAQAFKRTQVEGNAARKAIAKGIEGADKALTQVVFRADLMHRYTYFEALKKMGYSDVDAMAKTRTLGVRFSQRGTGLDPKAYGQLVKQLQNNYETAKRSGSYEDIKKAKRAYTSMAGWTVNPIAANYMHYSPFLRTSFNSVDAYVRAAKWRTGDVVKGLGATAIITMALEGAKDPKALFTTPEQTEYDHSKDLVVRYGDGENDIVKFPRGFVSRMSVPMQDAFLNVVKEASMSTWPDTLGKAIEDYDPELARAIKAYDPNGTKVARTFLTVAAEQIVPGIPVANIGMQAATGLDYAGNPIVPDYIQNPENPSAEVSDRTSTTLATFAKDLEKATGYSFSPMKTEYFMNQILPLLSQHVLATTDRVINAYSDTPELTAKEETLNPFMRYNNLNQVRRDEYKATGTFHSLWKEVKRSKAELDNAKAFYDESPKDDEDAENFLRIEEDNKELASLYDVLQPYHEELKNLYKQRSDIIKDVNLEYTTPDNKDRPWFGSKAKLEGLRELRLTQLDVIDRALETVKGLPNGENYLDKFGEKTPPIVSAARNIYRFANNAVEYIGFQEGTNQLESVDLVGPKDRESPQAIHTLTSEEMMALAKDNNMVPSQVTDVVEQAAQEIDVRPDILLAFAFLESTFDPKAFSKVEGASSRGLFGITDAWWQDQVDQFGDELDVSAEDRGDPYAEAKVLGAKIKEDQDRLYEEFGRKPTAADIYTLHFLGDNGGMSFLKTVQSADKVLPADDVFPVAAKNNPSYFYPKNSKNKFDYSNPRTVEEVYEEINRKISGSYQAITNYPTDSRDAL